MRTAAFGAGSLTVDERTGDVLAVTHPDAPTRRYLLDPDSEPWHTRSHWWGRGFVLTDRGGGRWEDPDDLRVEAPADAGSTGDVSRLTARHQPVPGLTLEVERAFGSCWSERYTFTNRSDAPISLQTLAICTPLRDVYTSDSLSSAVHAHIWTGGAYAYLLGVPMDGRGPVLGLRLTEGELWSYSIESREEFATSSNVRGHVLLQATDAGRAAHAFGGQPTYSLQPGERLVLAWELAWYADVAAFLAAHPAPARAERWSVPVGEQLPLALADGVEPVSADDQPGDAPEMVALLESGRQLRVVAQTPGVRHLDLQTPTGRCRIGLLWHLPRADALTARVTFALAHQRPTERFASRAHAFVPYDTQRQVRIPTGGWYDFSDARERVGTGLLVQLAGRHDPRAAQAADGYARYLRDCIVSAAGQVKDDSLSTGPAHRPYNLPWLVLFFLARHAAAGEPAAGRPVDVDDLDLALRLHESYYARGGRDFLAIGAGLSTLQLAEALTAAGRDEDARACRTRLLDHAQAITAFGEQLPAHEVVYEQSMVAPLVEILCVAWRFCVGDESAAAARRVELEDAIGVRLRWLLAFGGPQPHPRLYDIGIRHWDGFWFGREKLWGDVFPHYWSVLTGLVLRLLPEPVKAQLDDAEARADAIFAANLADLAEDGSTTCAFVYPSCVSHRAAHAADPLVNDQDWGLVLWLLADATAAS